MFLLLRFFLLSLPLIHFALHLFINYFVGRTHFQTKPEQKKNDYYFDFNLFFLFI